MNEQLLNNPKVGEILKEEFLEEIGMSQNALAKAIGVPSNRIHAIVNGTRRVTANTDLRLCRFFGLSDGYFLRLQNVYELMEAKRNLGDVLAEIKPYVTSS
ncbi:MAG: HigA family addiction module antitoxin [Pleurocapsa sp.]